MDAVKFAYYIGRMLLKIGGVALLTMAVVLLLWLGMARAEHVACNPVPKKHKMPAYIQRDLCHRLGGSESVVIVTDGRGRSGRVAYKSAQFFTPEGERVATMLFRMRKGTWVVERYKSADGKVRYNRADTKEVGGGNIWGPVQLRLQVV